MKQSTTSAIMANKFFKVLQRYTKGIRFAAVLTILLTLSIGQAWAWQSWYLYGDYQGSWDVNNKKNLSGTIENGKYFIAVYHPGSTKYFRLYSNNHYGPSSSKALPTGGEQGGYNGQTYAWYIDAAQKGIIRISIDQNNGKDWNPWVWWGRSDDVRLKHQWTSATWTYSSKMTDNNDGTYTLVTTYPSRTGGYNYSDYSSSGSYDVGYIETPTVIGSPATGNKCLFTLNTNNSTLTITKLCSLTYNGNENTGGVVPSAVEDKAYNTTITLSSTPLTKTGYTHTGWNTNANGTGHSYSLGEQLKLTEVSLTLYAQWTLKTYTVKWVVNGVEKNTENVNHGSNVENAPTIDPNNLPCGDVFAGWTTEFYAGKSAPAPLYKTAAEIPSVTDNVTYYAVFADYKE